MMAAAIMRSAMIDGVRVLNCTCITPFKVTAQELASRFDSFFSIGDRVK